MIEPKLRVSQLTIDVVALTRVADRTRTHRGDRGFGTVLDLLTEYAAEVGAVVARGAYELGRLGGPEPRIR